MGEEEGRGWEGRGEELSVPGSGRAEVTPRPRRPFPHLSLGQERGWGAERRRKHPQALRPISPREQGGRQDEERRRRGAELPRRDRPPSSPRGA